jgi:hypothetical protein
MAVSLQATMLISLLTPPDLKAAQQGADKLKSTINEQAHIQAHKANPVSFSSPQI